MLNKFITWCFLHNVTNIRHKLHKLMKLQNIRSAHGLSRHLSYAFFFRYIFRAISSIRVCCCCRRRDEHSTWIVLCFSWRQACASIPIYGTKKIRLIRDERFTTAKKRCEDDCRRADEPNRVVYANRESIRKLFIIYFCTRPTTIFRVRRNRKIVAANDIRRTDLCRIAISNDVRHFDDFTQNKCKCIFRRQNRGRVSPKMTTSHSGVAVPIALFQMCVSLAYRHRQIGIYL